MLEAAIWFWIPLCLVPVGIWFSISGKAKSVGKLVAAIGLILVLVSSWTVPSSDSTAGGHLLLSILAPSLLLAYGVHGMIFGGNVPVGRLDSSARWSGAMAILASLLIFCLMHCITSPRYGEMAKSTLTGLCSGLHFCYLPHL